jgi:hypothetical protein
MGLAFILGYVRYQYFVYANGKRARYCSSTDLGVNVNSPNCQHKMKTDNLIGGCFTKPANKHMYTHGTYQCCVRTNTGSDQTNTMTINLLCFCANRTTCEKLQLSLSRIKQ